MSIDYKSLKLRDTVFNSQIYCGGTASFNSATDKMLRLALTNSWVESNAEQGCGLTTEDYINFLERNPRFKAHGYAVSPKRADCRLELAGVILDKPPTKKELIDFVNTFRHSEHFTVTPDSLFAAD